MQKQHNNFAGTDLTLPFQDVTWKQLLGSRRIVIALLACTAISFACHVLFTNPHAGSVNQGDFYHYLDSADMTWAEDAQKDKLIVSGVMETYDYLPLNFGRLIGLKPSRSLIYPTVLIRGLSVLLGIPFSTFYISILYCIIMVLAGSLLFWGLYHHYGRGTLLVGLLFLLMTFGENFVAWFNSFYGEGSGFVGLLMWIGLCIYLSTARQGGKYSFAALLLLVFSGGFLMCAKPQYAIALPVVLITIAVYAVYHRPRKWVSKIAYSLILLACCGIICQNAVVLYQQNNAINEKTTLWHAVFNGLLVISHNPAADMKELGIDLVMMRDIGKHSYLPADYYVAPPFSKEADQYFYQHIRMGKILSYYVHHPGQLVTMLDYAASHSITYCVFPFRRVGEDYQQTADIVIDGTLRLPFWYHLRPVFALRAFWQYVLAYGILLLLCMGRLISKKRLKSEKLLTAAYLSVLLMGILQYPLSVLGNGMTDVNKQMYLFMVCHDVIVFFAFAEIIKEACHLARKACKRQTIP